MRGEVNRSCQLTCHRPRHYRLICSEFAVRLLQRLQALRPCWQREGCLQSLIEPVPALQLWVAGLLEQRAPYAHHLRGRGLYQSQLRKLRECGALNCREVVLGQWSLLSSPVNAFSQAGRWPDARLRISSENATTVSLG